MPEGHKSRTLLDQVSDTPDWLSGLREEYDTISLHKLSGFSGSEPLLDTLRKYDEQMWIKRHPWESEILLHLDLIERSERGKSKPPDPKPKKK